MEKSRSLSASVAAIIILELTFLISPAAAVTVPSDVSALQELYKNLNYPPQLVGWKSDGGDPCGESWLGISCDAASVVNIIVPRLGLRGYIAGQVNLPNLKELVLSFNEIQGEIPYFLPPNITYIDLLSNKFQSNIPQSFAIMKRLRHLILSHNILSGTIGNYFSDLQNLKQMDLSYNSFSGDLPSSFGNLSSLTGLFLQNNQLSGSVIPLANLPLTDLNIQNNNFSGFVPNQIQRVPNLWIWGNHFRYGADSPLWDSPSLGDLNIYSPAAIMFSFPTAPSELPKKRRLIPLGFVYGLLGGAVLLTCIALATRIQNNWSVFYNTQVLVLPSSQTGPKKRKAYLDLKTAVPIFLTLFSVLFTLSLSCSHKWIYLVFLGFSLTYFVWMGFEAFDEYDKMESECLDSVGNQLVAQLLDNHLGGNRRFRFHSCFMFHSCSPKTRLAIVAIFLGVFTTLYTVVLSLYVFTKTC